MQTTLQIRFLSTFSLKYGRIEQRNNDVETHIPREDSYISIQKYYTLVQFEVIQTNESLYADGMENHLINLGTFTLIL